METAEGNNKDILYDELIAPVSRISSQEVFVTEIDANAKMRLDEQSGVLGKRTKTLKLQLNYIQSRNIPHSGVQKSRGVRS
ncbi:hypothetical protein RB195_025594 [Necator americanus]|uniref:Uncharacterized protein n=1 Tax=Necator americanus TaxID=51031 RepID=A0ABR1ESZ9_NECAM